MDPVPEPLTLVRSRMSALDFHELGHQVLGRGWAFDDGRGVAGDFVFELGAVFDAFGAVVAAAAEVAGWAGVLAHCGLVGDDWAWLWLRLRLRWTMLREYWTDALYDGLQFEMIAD